MNISMKPSDIYKEAKVVYSWLKNTPNFIQKHPRITFGIILLLLSILVGESILVYYGLLDLRIKTQETIPHPAVNDLNVTAYFHLASGNEWKRNQTYDFELFIISNEKSELSTENMVYFKPLFKKGITPPRAINYSDSDFIEKKVIIKGVVDTSKSDEGWFNICALIRDKSNLKRKYEYCDERQIKVG